MVRDDTPTIKRGVGRMEKEIDIFCAKGGHLFMFFDSQNRFVRMAICKQCRRYFVLPLDSEKPLRELSQKKFYEGVY